jgi:hypothetical protein
MGSASRERRHSPGGHRHVLRLANPLSVGAMWVNVFVERRAYLENQPELLEFIKKYTLLLLVFDL